LLSSLPEQLESSPLRLFQAVTIERDEILRLLRSLNSECGEPINENSLAENFGNHWPDPIKAMQEIAQQKISAIART